MSNEELVLHIQQGKSELMGELYKNNLGIIRKISYSVAKDEDEYQYQDLIQEAYFALDVSVKHFDLSKGYKFISYFSKALKWYLLHYKSKADNKELLTLNSLIKNVKEDTDLEQIDLIADENAIKPDDNAEINDLILRTRFELNKLAEPERTATYLHYGCNIKNSIIAKKLEVPEEELSRMLRRVKAGMRYNHKLKEIFYDWIGSKFYQRAYKGNGLQMFKDTYESNVERLVMKKIEIERDILKHGA